MLHKLTRHWEEDAELFISDTHPECERLLKAVKEGGIFQNVNTFPDKGRMLPYKKEYGEKKNSEKLDILVNRLCEEIEKDFPFQKEDITEYNICGDQYSLGIWLIKHKIPYHFFEEGCGVYTRKHLLLENLQRLNPFQYDMAKKYQCMGDNPNISEKYLEFSSQTGDYDKTNCVDFSVKNILKGLEHKKLQMVLKTFKVPQNEMTKETSVLLLTQQFVNMGFLTVTQEKELYDSMLDYFALEGKLYIKPHPSDWQGLYEKWYPEATVFPRFMPSELLPYSVKEKFSSGITVSSTSIFGLEPFLEQIICLDSSLEDHYDNIHWYYAAGQMLKQEVCNHAQIVYEGECSELFHAMTGEDSVEKERKIVVTNKQKSYPEADVVVYLNEDEKNQIPDWMFEGNGELWPVAVQIRDLETGWIARHYLYIYGRDQLLMKMLKRAEVRKQLKYSEKEIFVDTEEYKSKCIALQGMLEATNQRVEALLKENKKLKENLKK